MDIIKELREMKDTIANEIAEANQRIRKSGGDMNTADVDIIDKLTHSMKSLATTVAMLEAQEDGYSGDYPYGGMYYRNNRNSYDSRGRDGMSNRYTRMGYSRNGDFMEHMHQMIDEAPDESTRMEIKKLMDKMDQR